MACIVSLPGARSKASRRVWHMVNCRARRYLTHECAAGANPSHGVLADRVGDRGLSKQDRTALGSNLFARLVDQNCCVGWSHMQHPAGWVLYRIQLVTLPQVGSACKARAPLTARCWAMAP